MEGLDRLTSCGWIEQAQGHQDPPHYHSLHFAKGQLVHQAVVPTQCQGQIQLFDSMQNKIYIYFQDPSLCVGKNGELRCSVALGLGDSQTDTKQIQCKGWIH